MHLWWQPDEQSLAEIEKPVEATAFYNELAIEQSTGGSYFMACGFSKGYFGIQELPDGKKIALFSIWEPGKQNNPNATPEERRVKKIASGEGVRVKRFGGEGTGGQSFYDYDWEIGESVRFVVFAKPDGPDRTQFAGYIYIPDESRWQHMATFSTLANGHLLRGYYSFVEDFLRNGKSATIVHRANFGNGWIKAKTKDGPKWLPLTSARFTADRTPTDNIDSGVVGDRVYLQTGGETKNEHAKLRESSVLNASERKPPLDLPDPFGERQSSLDSVRVLAYNIKHGRGNDGKVDLERTAQVIRRLNPDVVALQEIDNKATRSGNVDEAKRLAELTGLKHHAFGRFMDFDGGKYGMAVISRYPLTDVTDLRLPDGAEPRTSLIATVGMPQPFRLASVHFYATEEQRLAQAKTLLGFLGDHQDIPCVVAGDFNSKPDSPVLKLFSDWNIPPKGDDHLTFSSDNPRIEIDFIMHRPDTAFIVREIDVIDEPVASDHRPVTVDLSVVPRSKTRWWKGNLHTHSLWSDGNDFPEMIADWYRKRGYHFLALSDHNILGEGYKWMKLSDIESRNGKTALPKYLARFGQDWVETRGSRSDGSFEVRLKPLSEFRSLVESADEFMMIQSEEITDKGAHINATNIAEVIQPQGGDSVRETIQNNLRAVDEQAKRLGRTIIPHLNHPNLGDTGISAEDLAALVQDEFFEVFNGVDQDGDLGSDRRHSLETLWDITSALRISELNAAPMFGLATDDTHEYHGGKRLAPGRGWIMLRAKHLTRESIVDAMKRGDFYASSGVSLREVDFDEASKMLNIEIEPDGDAEFTTQFIGTPVDFDKTTSQRKDKDGNAVNGTLDYSADVGKVFATQHGHSVSYQLTGDELYVRATITSNKSPEDPTSESPLAKAWTQPVGWRSQLAKASSRE
ncbi:MAG: DUF3472 domain-containing protein [Planctomycetales bacterium]|nr:DUF3472 domain-containing protein [Planctomycetales bacterium]